MSLLTEPWPWYVAGPAIGLFVPALLLIGNKQFGVSGSFRHLCAACVPGRVAFFRYDWKRSGAWSLAFLAGIIAGGWLAGTLGGAHAASMVPADLFAWRALLTLPGLVTMMAGGLLVGFGTSYAGGCTSGHAVSGLAHLQLASLIAVVSFFATGALASRWLIPLLRSP
jgi:hypothetical protein